MADDDSLWQQQVAPRNQTTQPNVHRWHHVQTHDEQRDSQNSIRALGIFVKIYCAALISKKIESKLAQLKSRPKKTATATSIQEEGEWNDSIDTSAEQEDHEGLYLLWRERGHQEEEELDRALQQQKREEQYTWHWTISWAPRYCSCCFS
ncbi:hypothetical protein BJV82DRAFT_621345 [Fennellomyces sp. T-0311]|nr:hypothetical protein BJV82DRAFT_621345 [Fennellomyces sp. T-0311]